MKQIHTIQMKQIHMFHIIAHYVIRNISKSIDSSKENEIRRVMNPLAIRKAALHPAPSLKIFPMILSVPCAVLARMSSLLSNHQVSRIRYQEIKDYQEGRYELSGFDSKQKICP